MKKLICAITIFLATSLGANAYTLRESVQETLSKRGVKQSIIDETSEFLLYSKGGMSIIPQKNEISSLINKAEKLLKKDKNNIQIKQYLISIYSIKGDTQSILKAKKLLEENLKEKDITDFESWSMSGFYYYQIGEKKKAQEYFDKIKEKYKDRPAVYKLIEIVLTDIDLLSKSKKFSDTVEDLATNEKDLEEIEKNFKKQVENLKIVEDFFQSEQNKREFGVVDELVYNFNFLIHASKIYELMEENSKGSKGLDLKTREEIKNYYLKNIANNEKMTEDAIRYNIVPESTYLLLIAVVTSIDEEEGKQFVNELEKTKLYKIMKELEK